MLYQFVLKAILFFSLLLWFHQESAHCQPLSIISSAGTQQANDYSFKPKISADGRFVVFESMASNLVAGDTNQSADVFIHDRTSGAISLVSRGLNGTLGNASSFNSSISPDARYITFASYASNLVAGDTNGFLDIFLFDRQVGTTTLMSKRSDGAQSNEYSDYSSVSADGRYVAFSSYASNLVEPDTNDKRDVFLHDRNTGQTTRLSVTSTGKPGLGRSYAPVISPNGEFVAFASLAFLTSDGAEAEVEQIMLYDIAKKSLSVISASTTGTFGDADSYDPQFDASGRYIAFGSKASNLVSGDSNNKSDIFLFDRIQKTIARVSVASGGLELDDNSFDPSINHNGTFVSFSTRTRDLLPDSYPGAALFVHRLADHSIGLVSWGTQTKELSGDSVRARMNADGSLIVFQSGEPTLVSTDQNSMDDILIRGTSTLDFCPSDPLKTQPLICGCGNPDTDKDGDGALDCQDGCPNDPSKKAAGICGCGISDKDTDNDGTLDCFDKCPSDPKKIAPGICGCEKTEIDSDKDGKFDCVDACPNDPSKTTTSGFCGCGKAETDSDRDGRPDCVDQCPNDPTKTSSKGSCGCGNSEKDSDGDFYPDCVDLCPSDPKKSFTSGSCGCGKSELDTDSDGYPDCVDSCPLDRTKRAAGTCGCGQPESDLDSDGKPDCVDKCPNDYFKSDPGVCGCGIRDTDNDSDGTINCKDQCPYDGSKTQPGQCGCGVSDRDGDKDGTPDCRDTCPNDPGKLVPGTCGCGYTDKEKNPDGSIKCFATPLCQNPGPCGCSAKDSDMDGAFDCEDGCPHDPKKLSPGACDCGVKERDANVNGIIDCLETSSTIVPPAPRAFIRKNKLMVKIPVSQQLSNRRYQVELLRKGTVIRAKITNSSKGSFRCPKVGSYQVRYSLIDGQNISNPSNTAMVRVRRK